MNKKRYTVDKPIEEYSTNKVAIKSRKRYMKLTDEQYVKRLGYSKKSTELRNADPERRANYLKVQKESWTKFRNKIPTGKCVAALYCKKEQAGKSKYCLEHWIRSIARKYSEDKNRQEHFDISALLNLWHKQNGCCAITGIPLIPGSTATIDHILPVSKGGTNDIDNLRFVHYAVNLFKKDSTDNELVNKIVELAPKLLDWATPKIEYLFQGI